MYKLKAKERRALFVGLLGGCCVNCGTTESLEFDHVMCDRKFAIGNHLLNSLELILPELQKCQLLCTPCHREKTNSDFGFGVVVHGTPGMYTNHGCRCDLCKKAWAIYVRPGINRWREAQRAKI